MVDLQLQDIQDVKYTDQAFEVTKKDGSVVTVSNDDEAAFATALQFAVDRENAKGHNISETSRIRENP